MNEEELLDEPCELSNETEEIPDAALTDEITEEAPQTSEQKITELQATIASLEATIRELENKSQTQARMLEELADFNLLFPEADIDAIPESVWDSVKAGSSLPAAYALYEKRCDAEQRKIEAINAVNASKAAGKAGKSTASEYFSPDEVRKMSRSEVHANYSKIKESMKKWL